MKVSLAMFVAAASLVLACEKGRSTPPAERRGARVIDAGVPAPGSDRDAHGCIGSAGYLWCATEKACVRPPELAKAKGIANDAAAFAAYCNR